MFYSCISQVREKNPGLPIEKFPFLVLTRNTIVLQHLIIHFSLHYLSSGRLQEVKNKGKFQTFSSKNGCACLQEVPNIVIWLGNFWYFGKLVTEERWLLMSGGHNRRFNCISWLIIFCMEPKGEGAFEGMHSTLHNEKEVEFIFWS